MEVFPIHQGPDGLEIRGIPDGAKAIQLTGDRARNVADLGLHMRDLRFALDCLDAINEVPLEWPVVRKALWRSALVHFYKCFGKSKSRVQLDVGEVYAGEDDSIFGGFEHYRHLRNKHVVHDENSYTQGIPGAVLNDGQKAYKVEKVVCFMAEIMSVTQENWSNLRLLASKAHGWVVREFDRATAELTAELETLSYEELAAHEPLSYRAPDSEDVAKRRYPSPEGE